MAYDKMLSFDSMKLDCDKHSIQLDQKVYDLLSSGELDATIAAARASVGFHPVSRVCPGDGKATEKQLARLTKMAGDGDLIAQGELDAAVNGAFTKNELTLWMEGLRKAKDGEYAGPASDKNIFGKSSLKLVNGQVYDLKRGDTLPGEDMVADKPDISQTASSQSVSTPVTEGNSFDDSMDVLDMPEFDVDYWDNVTSVDAIEPVVVDTMDVSAGQIEDVPVDFEQSSKADMMRDLFREFRGESEPLIESDYVEDVAGDMTVLHSQYLIDAETDAIYVYVPEQGRIAVLDDADLEQLYDDLMDAQFLSGAENENGGVARLRVEPQYTMVARGPAAYVFGGSEYYAQTEIDTYMAGNVFENLGDVLDAGRSNLARAVLDAGDTIELADGGHIGYRDGVDTLSGKAAYVLETPEHGYPVLELSNRELAYAGGKLFDGEWSLGSGRSVQEVVTVETNTYRSVPTREEKAAVIEGWDEIGTEAMDELEY